MRKLYSLLLVIIALMIPKGAWADVWQDPETKVNYEYTPGQSEAGVKKGTGWDSNDQAGCPEASGDIAILSSFTIGGETYTVTEIRNYAFAHCNNLTSVKIPNTINFIGIGAFAECWSLHSINIPESVKYLCPCAFMRCALTSIDIPGSVESIGYQAFLQCSRLETVTIGEGVTTIRGTNVSDHLDGGAFSWCFNLKKVTLPESLKEIGTETFGGCNKLSAIELPKNLEKIGKKAFYGTGNECERFDVYSHIEEPFALNEVFDGNGKNPDENTLYVPVGTKAKYEATEGWKEFKNIVEMESENKDLKVGDTFTTDGITYQVTSIDPMEVQVGDGKHSVIDDVTPMDVDIPSTVTGPDSNVYTVKSIAKLAFFDCNEVTSIKLPSTIVSIGDQSFQACWKVPSITIPKSVTYIGFRAFAECSKLTEIYSQIEEPFALADEAFRYKYINAETYYNRVTLYVPAGTKAKYEATDGWKEFKNIVEIAMLDPIDGETTVSTDNLGNEDLSDNVVNDVYYNVGSEGYDASDKSVVISQTTNMGQITDATPGSSEVKNNFNGLILKVAAGKGTITVNVKTTGNAQLVVQVGNQTPMIASKTEQGDVVVSYDVAEDTYVYIYAIIGSSAAPVHRAAPADAVKIYSIKVTPGATGIDTVHSSQSTVHSCYTLDGRKLQGQPTKKGVYIVNGRQVVVK